MRYWLWLYSPQLGLGTFIGSWCIDDGIFYTIDHDHIITIDGVRIRDD
jgi:hypothetical protein